MNKFSVNTFFMPPWFLTCQVFHPKPSSPPFQITLWKSILGDLHSSGDAWVSFTRAVPWSVSFHMAWPGASVSALIWDCWEHNSLIFLFLLRWTFLIRCLIWSWEVSLCFNNTCDRIYLFAFKVVNYGVHLKWAITAKKSSLLGAYRL